VWKELQNNSNILKKLKIKEYPHKVTSAHRLENTNIYYYNYQDPPKYQKARLIIFGMHQYNENLTLKPIDRELIEKVLAVIANSAMSNNEGSNIDVCYDLPFVPNLQPLKQNFKIKPYKGSRYVNTPDMMAVEKINIDDKSYKNGLKSTLYRVEATVQIHNLKDIFISLDDIFMILLSHCIKRMVNIM